ncbi:MAG: bifunctional hydroxymethylpyrimidine kinase/phosphomethylpyrimidine kinase [Deltaproteobacteria bacterium]|nr:bifunctional hydroxymethylpyrimidine kinase/phosphomethylpyrimidine kinase [Deltaproteobacteria bacterium]
MSNNIPTVLTIAGSDPSGGAGIQADLKTLSAAGVYGAAAITALTAQNTTGVSAIAPVDPAFVKKQIKAVLSDIRIDVIKLGMLFDDKIARAVAPFLQNHKVICDPVMMSGTGESLEGGNLFKALGEEIFPACDFITPNVFELETICGKTGLAAAKAVAIIMERFPKLSGIVVKGGHVDMDKKTVRDRLFLRENHRIKTEEFRHERVKTKNLHGTGCTFAAAFAAFLARKFTVREAFIGASDLTAKIISASAGYKLGSGHGPLMHHLVCAK